MNMQVIEVLAGNALLGNPHTMQFHVAFGWFFPYTAVSPSLCQHIS
jgi:hypothetical protein